MKANDFIKTEALQRGLDVKAIEELQVELFFSFEVLPKTEDQ